MKMYVGNLAYSVTDTMLRETFSQYGEVSQVTVISDKFTGRSKGFGFVEMPDSSEANSAMNALNDAEMLGRKIKVNEARPQTERPQRNSRW
ncbi:MAG TPA: RNA-binding protein [Bacteroidota bacterium]|nr:RNA-binding protein [Bacteroidota bacterium]